jgi:hypothetical protein
MRLSVVAVSLGLSAIHRGFKDRQPKCLSRAFECRFQVTAVPLKLAALFDDKFGAGE